MGPDNFLLEEYKRFADAFWKNEEVGEKRLNYFITLTTAVIGAVVTLITSKNDLLDISEVTAYQIATAALAGTFLFGLSTYFRMLQRDHVTREYKAILDYIRKELSRKLELGGYELPFKPSRHWLLRGSLSVSVAVMNSIILAVICAIWLEGIGQWIGGALLFVLSFALHAAGVKRSKREA